MAGNKREVLRLYKLLLRESGKFPSYIYRTYALRRVKDAFREQMGENDPEKIKSLLSFASENLEIVKRQVVIGELYASPPLIIEKIGKPSAK